MAQRTFVPTLQQQTALSFAYLAYSGELLTDGSKVSVPLQILRLIKAAMPKIPPLKLGKTVDWEVVWGPAIYTFPDAILQDNMMFVARQISQPENYVLAVRGTNAEAVFDWLKEDLEVWRKVPWRMPQGQGFQGQPCISQSTQDGLNVLLNSMRPGDVPGKGENITSFLRNLAEGGKANLLFTGHSLGAALASTLALWFKQWQHIDGEWDPQGNIHISSITFAGPTAGNQDFADYFNGYLGAASQRIFNTLDVVPKAWQVSTMNQIPAIYSPQISMPLPARLALEVIERVVIGYAQTGMPIPLSWEIQATAPSWVGQLGVQHSDSYPNLLSVPALLKVINRGY